MIAYQVLDSLWHAQNPLRFEPYQARQLRLNRSMLESLAHVDSHRRAELPSSTNDCRPVPLLISCRSMRHRRFK